MNTTLLVINALLILVVFLLGTWRAYSSGVKYGYTMGVKDAGKLFVATIKEKYNNADKVDETKESV